MRAELKRIHSPDTFDVAAFEPKDSECFALLFQLMIGPSGTEGEESFDVIVCTPQWLQQQYGPSNVVVGMHHLIVFQYDFERIRRRIERFIASCEGESWEGLARQLSRLGRWEFEDYVPYSEG